MEFADSFLFAYLCSGNVREPTACEHAYPNSVPKEERKAGCGVSLYGKRPVGVSALTTGMQTVRKGLGKLCNTKGSGQVPESSNHPRNQKEETPGTST